MSENSLNIDSLNTALLALEHCREVLEQVADTCCTPERSPQMEGVADELQKARIALREGRNNPGQITVCITAMTECGSRIRKLQVSCCTETRDPLYQQILHGLTIAQEHVDRAMGKGD